MDRSARMKIRKGLRALAAMIRSIKGLAGSIGCMGRLPGFQCTLHLRIGINQEVRTAYDVVPFGESLCHSVTVAKLPPQFDKARLQLAFAFVHKNNIPLARWQNGSD